MYSNRIITQLNADVPEDKKLSANECTQIFGICSTISSLLAFYVASKFSRKTLFIAGQILMTLCLLTLSFFTYMNNGIVVIIFISLFASFYYITMNAAHWVYVPEILSDQQWGFVATVHYAQGIELSIVSEYMIEYMKPEGTFLFYSFICFLGIFWFVFVVKETQGLSDRQKKTLYLP